jgi:hypothetical protein
MTPIALSQVGAAPTTQSAQRTKRGAQGTQTRNSLRAHRLAQVAQANREAQADVDVEPHRPLPPPIAALLSEYLTCTVYCCVHVYNNGHD